MAYCPKCGEQSKEGDAFCRYCGTAITRGPGDSEKASVEAQEKKDSAAQAEPAPILRVEEPGEPIQEQIITGRKEMFCRNCGKELTGTPEICMNCGARPSVGSSFCHACGAETNPLAEICIKCGVRLGTAGIAGDISPKSRLATTLLAWFLGEFGAHRFYLGKIGTAILMLFTLGGLGIWALIDFIIAVTGNMKDKEGKLIKDWQA